MIKNKKQTVIKSLYTPSPSLPFQWKEGEGQRPWEGNRVVKEAIITQSYSEVFLEPYHCVSDWVRVRAVVLKLCGLRALLKF